jgi:hypothetical protein
MVIAAMLSPTQYTGTKQMKVVATGTSIRFVVTAVVLVWSIISSGNCEQDTGLQMNDDPPNKRIVLGNLLALGWGKVSRLARFSPLAYEN